MGVATGAWCLFLAAVTSANILEPIFRLGNIPFSAINGLMGTSHAPNGGLTFPFDSRVVAIIARPPFLTSGQSQPIQNPACHAYWRSDPTKAARAAQKLAAQAAGRRSSLPGEPMMSLIDDPSDIAQLTPELLPCLYYLGYAPPSIPQGPAYGRVYSVLGSDLINDISQTLWGGKVLMSVPCGRASSEEEVLSIVVNYVSNSPAVWGELYVGLNPRLETLGYFPDEIYDDEESLFVDYSADFEARCPSVVPRYYDAADGHAGSFVDRIVDVLPRQNSLLHDLMEKIPRPLLPAIVGSEGALFPPAQTSFSMFNNAWPLRDVVDTLRWVGRDETYGTDIYLGRAMLAFPEGLRTVAWFNLKVPELLNVTVVHQPL